MTTRTSRLVAMAALAAALAFPGVASAKALKLATLAPAGSAWMNLFDRMNSDLSKATGGRLKFKFYSGGASGDEKDMVRKMRINQLHCAAVTAVGLGEIQPHVLVLQLPLLFDGYRELDYVRDAMKPRFEKIFADKGYVILGWGDVGKTYIMSNHPVRTLADLKQTKMWVWVDDPIGKKVFEVSGITPVPLSVPDVLPSLQTGLIDAVYTSPLASIALQWHTKLKYISTLPLAMGIGATVITKIQWDKLSPTEQTTLRSVADKWHTALVDLVRKDNKTSVKSLKASGIKVIKVSAAQKAEWQAVAAKVRNDLAGRLYPAELLAEVEGHVKAFRSGAK